MEYRCTESDQGRKLYYILRNGMGVSASLLKRLKNAGAVFLNGEPAFTTVTVMPGDIVTIDLIAAEREADLEPEAGDIEILFENEAMLIVNKPAGMIVHPSIAKYRGSLAAFAAGYLQKTGQDARCHVVNRLDRDTSGCVVFAKNAYYKTALSEALASSDAEKVYLGVMYGALGGGSFTISQPIKRAEPQKMLRIVSPDGKRAVTHCEILGSDGEMTLARFTLETGRTHQIRVHSAYIGHPLLGDALYGTEESIKASELLGITAQALHAVSIRLRDPITGNMITAEAPVRRQELQSIIEVLWKNRK
ncbi:MAG: RluA family pseudouridine synthase [Oscillospiraceae bacterium]|nr:RluA family pseudouridine synthase [Oscillospiraceae bacterium]